MPQQELDLAPSLNDCLEGGPPLQSQLWKVLLRGMFHAVALSGDIRKAFLQARIREQDRDALRFHWLDGKNQRLAKQVLTIPRRELISGHIAVNLLRNVQDALQGFPETSPHCWLHSSVALHWILGGGDYEHFMANRVRKIRKHVEVSWRHVPTENNPTDLASRSRLVSKENQPWWRRPLSGLVTLGNGQ